MKRTNESTGRMKVLTSDELAHVIGGTGDPSKPIGDPGESGNYGDMEAVGQNWNGHR
jgi:bacteriocin-like protein